MDIINRTNIDQEYVLKAIKYYVNHKTTIRDTVSKYNLSKTYLHSFMIKKLREIDIELYEKAKELLYMNIITRASRGGIKKWENYKKKQMMKEITN